MTDRVFRVPGPERQLRFHQLLVAARKTVLMDALRSALAEVEQAAVKAQVMEYVPEDVQQVLAAAGIRDEYVFPLPVLLETSPTLVGYYRLLLGSPQKSFYSSETGLGLFHSMEQKGAATPAQCKALPAFCAAMSKPLADLVRQMSPSMSVQDIQELPLITLGSQFQGGNNNVIGRQATMGIFLAITDLVEPHLIKRTENRLVLRNAAGRTVTIALASDPDVSIVEQVGDASRNRVAIEIKGGTDRSNAHNRAGEAGKSHQKAKSEDYRDFWTIIAKKGVDFEQLTRESPTTTSWFDVAEVLAREGQDWDEFRSRIAEVAGIPLP